MITMIYWLFISLFAFLIFAISKLIRRVSDLKDAVNDQSVGIRRIERELWPPEPKAFKRRRALSEIESAARDLASKADAGKGFTGDESGSTRGREY